MISAESLIEGSTWPATTTAAAANSAMSLFTTDQTYEFELTIQRSAELGTLMQELCSAQGLDIRRARFFINGERIQLGDTAESLNIVDGDHIKM